MPEYRYVGTTPTDLDGGRPIGPGEYTGPIEVDPEENPKNRLLVDEGLLIPTETAADEGQLEGDALDLRAKELDIKGRSQMSADELRHAIALVEQGEVDSGSEQDGDS